MTTDAELVARIDRGQHVGRHICLDGRWYDGDCLVTDESCHYLAAAILRKRSNGVA